MLRALQHMESSSLCLPDLFLLAPEPPDGGGLARMGLVCTSSLAAQRSCQQMGLSA